MVCTVLHVIYPYNPATPATRILLAQINLSCLVAAGMFGKGLLWQGLTQIGGLVSIGKHWADQTKTTNGLRLHCEKYGKGW